MNCDKFLSLELFHVLFVNKVYYDRKYESWINGRGNSNTCNLIKQDDVIKLAAMLMSGINKKRANIIEVQPYLEQIKDWCVISKARPVKTFNVEIGAFRYVPACLVRIPPVQN